jgi:hypothetical protein
LKFEKERTTDISPMSPEIKERDVQPPLLGLMPGPPRQNFTIAGSATRSMKRTADGGKKQSVFDFSILEEPCS